MLIDHAVDKGSLLVSAFIDYVAAFDSVSHHFLDEAMAEAGGSDKCRMVFRAIYGKATAVVRVQTSGGEEAVSDAFSITRGVLQGDVLSPLCFVLALQRVMQLHDTPVGVTLGEWLVHALEYADDQALLETDVSRLSQRTTALQAGALASADMCVSVPKTEVVLFRKHQEEEEPLSRKEVERLLEAGGSLFKCSHNCGAFFDNDQGRDVHERSCAAATRGIYEHEYEPEEVIDVRGQPSNRFYQVVWKGWPRSVPENVTWEPARHLVEHTALLDSFWSNNAPCDREFGTHEVEGEHRCQWCCKFCNNSRARKLHEATCSEKPKVWKMRKRAVQTAVRVKRAKEQAGLDRVKMGEDRLKNVYSFVYLGHRFQADGDSDSEQAVEVRMAKAKSRFKELHEVWRSKLLTLKVKLMLYTHAVISILVHGHEAWDLNPRLQVRLNGWNSRCVAIITGRDIRQEAGRAGQTFDLVSHLRVRRLKWVGHVLRMDDQRYPKLALKAVWEARGPGAKSREGSVLMDVPRCSSFAELEALAGTHHDHPEWSQLVRELRERVSRQ